MIQETMKARQAFSDIAALDEDAFSLDRAALALALEEYPYLDVQDYLRRLDTLAARAGTLAGVDRSAVNIIESINEVLFVQEGLRGNSEDYYDPRNSYINEVLDRKLGIPISLSVIYMETARRINFPVEGIGFPGRFLMKHAAGERDIIIDAYDLGRILTPGDCQELLDRMHDSGITLNAAMLQPMGKKAIITRMLYNLKGIYSENEQYYKAISVIDKILMLNPGAHSEIRDRGILYMQTSLFAKALADLESYMAHTAAPDDVVYVKNHIRTLRNIVCEMN